MVRLGGTIAHHGIKGQKWGTRRWQNEDGSLTPAGREHYYGTKSSGQSANGRSNAGKTIKVITKGTGKAVKATAKGAATVVKGTGKAVKATAKGAATVVKGTGKAVKATAKGAATVVKGTGKAVKVAGKAAKIAVNASVVATKGAVKAVSTAKKMHDKHVQNKKNKKLEKTNKRNREIVMRANISEIKKHSSELSTSELNEALDRVVLKQRLKDIKKKGGN